MNKKKALKGLKGGVLFPVVSNTEEAYSVGTKTALPTLQSLSKEDTMEEYVIYADDGIYDQGADYTSTTLTLTLAELTPDLESELSGAKHGEDGVLMRATTDVAPEFAFGYAALMSNGGYRQFLHPVCKLTQISVSHETKGATNDIAPYEVTLVTSARKIDNVYRLQEDVNLGAPFTLLNEIKSLPDTGAGG